MPNRINQIQAKPKSFDFSSSGLGKLDATSVWFNDFEFFNALELLSVDADFFQSEVCSCCGCEGCSSGSWVSLRRFGEAYLFVPAIEEMLEGKWEIDEYGPPYFLRKYGVPAFSEEKYLELKKWVTNLPEPDAVLPMKHLEFVAVLQLEAPGRILGNLGDPVSLNKDMIIAANVGELNDLILAFEQLLQLSQPDKAIGSLPNAAQEIEFILDLPNFPSWKPMVYSKEKPYLHLEMK